MNIGLPEPQNGVAALFGVGVALFIAPDVDYLNWRQGGIHRWVAVPKIAVPLNDDPVIWEQGVHNKPSADDLLFGIGEPGLLQYGMTRQLQGIQSVASRKPEYAIDAFHVSVVVPVCAAAVFRHAVTQSPSTNVKRFATSGATQDLAAASLVNSADSPRVSRLRRVLPSVGAGQRTESYLPFATRHKHPAAPFTGIGAAIIATLLKVRAWRKRLVTLLTDLCAGYVTHNCIIPWLVGIVKWN